MRRKYIRPVSRTASYAPRFSFLALLLLAGAIILHRFGIIKTENLPYFITAISVTTAISLILIYLGLRDLWREGAKGGLASLKGLILVLPSLAVLLFIAGIRFIFPPLYDISTDFTNPPPFPAGIRPLAALPIKRTFSPKSVSEQTATWPQLSGRRYDGSPDTVLKAIYAVLKAKNWDMRSSQGKAGEDKYIFVTAVAKTLIMGFTSDILIRITDEGDTSFVDMRAAARYLPRDYGIDARFIEEFMESLDLEILSLPAADRID